MVAKYADNIDTCSALLFNQVMTGKKQPSALKIKGIFSSKSRALKAWKKLFNEYLEVFGLPTEYIMYLKRQIKANDARIDVYVKGKTHKKAMIEVYDYEASTIIDTDGADIGATAAQISDMKGFLIEPEKVSVRTFYSMLKSLNNG